MAKTQRGLPASYNLDVPDNLPVQIGDYLDEEETPPPIKEPIRRPTQSIKQPTEQIVQLPREEAPVEQETRNTTQKVGQGKVMKTVSRPPRQQVNMDIETEKMFVEIVRYVREYGPQYDARASEVLSGIVRELYKAREHITFGEVSRRGAWGSPTAKAYTVALGHAFSKAIIDGYAEEEESPDLKVGNL